MLVLHNGQLEVWDECPLVVQALPKMKQLWADPQRKRMTPRNILVPSNWRSHQKQFGEPESVHMMNSFVVLLHFNSPKVTLNDWTWSTSEFKDRLCIFTIFLLRSQTKFTDGFKIASPHCTKPEKTAHCQPLATCWCPPRNQFHCYRYHLHSCIGIHAIMLMISHDDDQQKCILGRCSFNKL